MKKAFLQTNSDSYENGKKLILETYSMTTLNRKKIHSRFHATRIIFLLLFNKKEFQVWIKDPPAHIYEQFVNV